MDFIAQTPDIIKTGINLILHMAILWLPQNISYVFSGKKTPYILQNRLAFIGTIVFLIEVSVFEFSIHFLTLLIATINWLLIILSIKNRDNINSEP